MLVIKNIRVNIHVDIIGDTGSLKYKITTENRKMVLVNLSSKIHFNL